MCLNDFAKSLVRDKSNLARGQSCSRVIYPLKDEPLKINEVARYVKCSDLPLVVGQRLISAGKPFNKKAAFTGRDPARTIIWPASN